MIKKSIGFGFVVAASVSSVSFAEPVVSFSIEEGDQLGVQIDSDAQPFSVFSKNDALWLVFAHREMARINLPQAVRQKFDVEGQSLLDVDAGNGLAIQFENLPTFTFTVKDAPSSDLSPSVLALKEGLIFSKMRPQILTARETGGAEGVTLLPALHLVSSPAEVSFMQAAVQERPAYAGYVFEKDGKPVGAVYSQGHVFVAETKAQAGVLALTQEAREPVVETPKTQDSTPQINTLSALETPEVIISGASKIILRPQAKKEAKPIAKVVSTSPTTPLAKQAVSATTDVQLDKPVSDTQAVASIDVADAEVSSVEATSVPFVDKTNVDAEQLTQHRIAPIQTIIEDAPKEEKPTPVSDFKRDPKKFADALSEITKAQEALSQVYIPPVREKAENLPTIKPLTSTVDSQESEFSFEEDNFLEENAVQQKVLPEDDLSLLAKEVLGDFVDVKHLEEVEADVGIDLAEDSFFQPVDFMAVSDSDPLFKFYGDGTDSAYGEYYRRILEALANIKDPDKKRLYRLALAKLTVGYKRPFETLMVLDNMEKDPDTGIFVDEGARILAVAANLLINREDDAALYLENLGAKHPEDAEVWSAFYAETQDQDKRAADLFEKNLSYVRTTYPPSLVKDIYLSYGRVLLRLERLSRLKRLIQNLSTYMPDGKLPSEGLLMLAHAHILERNDDLAETLLAQAAASENPNVAFMAQYAFVDFLLSNGDLGINRAISHLETLRYLWRGGKVESEILMKLGRMYIANGRHRLGLWRLKQHNTYFPDEPQNVEDTSEMMSIAFRDLFLDADIETIHQPLELLGIYYDFRELTPPGREGDQLISEIAERLRMLRLFDRAIDLLESQLKHRVKTAEDRSLMGARLAELYYLNRQYQDGLNALNRTEEKGVSQKTLDKRSVVHARLLIGLRRYADALKVLENVKNPDADYLIAHVAWILETYPQVIAYYQPKFDDTTKVPEEWGHDERVGVTELAVAYNMTGRLRELESLQKRYQKQIDADENLKNMFDFLLMERGSDIVIVPEKKDDLWPKMTDAMGHYHTFVDFYKEFRQKRHENREEKDIFNRRMRQMSAPARLK